MINSIKDLKSVSCGGEIMTHNDRPLFTDGSVDWDLFDHMRESDHPLCIDHDKDMISFKMMTKPASEGGRGCQFTDLIEVALHQLKYLNGKFPCRESSITITKLQEALMWQEQRTKDRLSRAVEGRDVK